MFNEEKFIVFENDSIKTALKKIHTNQLGTIFITDSNKKIIGISTDGDIRKGMINGLSIEDKISSCTNYKFVSFEDGAPREQVIKKLDNKIKIIPIIDKLGNLKKIVSRNDFPIQDQQSTYIRSRAPVRVSFGGGGSDLTHYFENDSGAVINATISIYSHATMRLLDDSRIIINSLDLDKTLVAKNYEDAISKKGPFGLIQSILKIVKPDYGLELNLNSDFPLGSGLGGSATLSAAILGCFNMLRDDQWTQYEIAEIAFQAERLNLGISGGWQDQYAAVFGGFNFIEFNANENIVNPIRINSDTILELEESLILCDTGLDHNSGNIHDNQKETMTSAKILKMVQENVELCYKSRNHLLKGNLNKFGECLDQAWKLKRNFSSMISNDYIDEIYNGAMKNGATGGKLLGAGGGGFFLFYAPPFKKYGLIKYLQSKKLTCKPFKFESEGLKSWKCRNNNIHSL